MRERENEFTRVPYKEHKLNNSQQWNDFSIFEEKTQTSRQWRWMKKKNKKIYFFLISIFKKKYIYKNSSRSSDIPQAASALGDALLSCLYMLYSLPTAGCWIVEQQRTWCCDGVAQHLLLTLQASFFFSRQVIVQQVFFCFFFFLDGGWANKMPLVYRPSLYADFFCLKKRPNKPLDVKRATGNERNKIISFNLSWCPTEQNNNSEQFGLRYMKCLFD